jgi:hypothetical protein
MFASGANTFLRVGHARWFPRRPLLAEKDRDELVHARIGEEQIRRVGYKRRRRDTRVRFLAKEIEE